MKKKVLVVDLDPQGNATAGLGVDRKSIDFSIYDVLFGNSTIGDVILETESGVYLLPSSLDLLMAETHMAGQVDNTLLLRNGLKGFERYFDYILIDGPPASNMLMINGIVASENIIIPMDSGVFACEALETLKSLILDIHDEIGIETNIMMVLLRNHPPVSMVHSNPTFTVSKMVNNFLKDNNIDDVKIIQVPFSRKVFKSQMKGRPISHYAPLSAVGQAYKKIAEEVLKYG